MLWEGFWIEASVMWIKCSLLFAHIAINKCTGSLPLCLASIFCYNWCCAINQSIFSQYSKTKPFSMWTYNKPSYLGFNYSCETMGSACGSQLGCFMWASCENSTLYIIIHSVQCAVGPIRSVQWNLQIKDTLGAELLSSFWRLSFGGRFKPICNL